MKLTKAFLMMVLPAWLGLAGGAGAAPADPPAEIAPRLERALADPAACPRDGQGRLAVWVFFRDKGLRGEALAAALAEAEASLPPHAAWRRGKMRAAGTGVGKRGADGRARLVDERDLPVARRGLDAVAAVGAAPRRLSRWLNAASFDATPDQVRRIALLPGVARLDLVAKFRRPPPPPPSPRPDEPAAKAAPGTPAPAGAAVIDTAAYGASFAALAQIDVPAVHAAGWTGAGVIIGMLDTGFKTTHEALDGIPVLGRWDFVNNDPVVADEPDDPVGSQNHGTYTLSALMGYAPGYLVGPAYGAAVALAKTEDISVEVPLEEDNWVAGLEWLDTFGVDVVSSSLGYLDWYTFADLDGDTAVTTRAADLAAARGIVVCASAGNERATAWGHIIAPADGDSVLAVGAVNLDGTIAYFSSPGPTADGRIKPDFCTLGVAVPVASPVSDTAYAAVSGTSLSCPLASGVAALLLQRAPGLTPWQVREALRETASRAATPDNDFGWGILDAAAALDWYGPHLAHTALPDTLPPAPAYPVGCRIDDRLPLDPAALQLFWRADGGVWQALPLAPAGADSFHAVLPAATAGLTLEYYLAAADSAGIATVAPAGGATAPWRVVIAGAPTGAGDLPAARTALLAVRPNPFNPRTEIRYTLARAGRASVRVHDARGAVVRTLLAADLPAGPGAVVWDGRDDAGAPVASGVYYCRLAADGVADTRRLTLVR
ncbi:MAG: S8 family serine peptidase [Candidatus Krumholzibacteriia bacterium]